MKKTNGFTLIELMIVVAIIGILSAIAYPAYNNYAQKTRRTEGQALLMEVMQAQERHYTVNQTYVTDLTALGYGSATVDTPEGFYNIAAAACGGGITSCVSLTATAKGGQTVDGDLTLDSVGNKTPASKW